MFFVDWNTFRDYPPLPERDQNNNVYRAIWQTKCTLRLSCLYLRECACGDVFCVEWFFPLCQQIHWQWLKRSKHNSIRKHFCAHFLISKKYFYIIIVLKYDIRDQYKLTNLIKLDQIGFLTNQKMLLTQIHWQWLKRSRKTQ